MLAFFRFIKFYTVEETRKWITKSGIPTPNIEPFNPGTFVEALNKNGGFDG